MQKGKRALATGGVLILWILLSIVSYYLLAIPYGKKFDFYPRWEGARAVLARENPYSLEVSWRIQEEMFGRRQESHEVVQHFVYLATITWLLLPFWILPYKLAVSLWCGLQLMFLLLCPVLTVHLLKWKLRPRSFLILLLFSVLIYRYPINTYILGQFIPFILTCLLIAWWGTVNNNFVATLLGLAGMLVRPEVVVVPLGVLLIHNWIEGRKKVVVSWGAIVVLLWLLTRIWIGPWVLDFIKGVDDYTGYSFISWLPLSAGNIFVGFILIFFVIGWGIQMWRSMRNLPSRERLPWEIAVSALVTLLVFPQPNNYTLILALVAIWVALWASQRKSIDWLISMAVLTSPWLFLIFQKSLPFALERLLIPFATGLLLTFQWRRREYFVNNDASSAV